MSMEDLLSALSDYLLQSGFQDSYLVLDAGRASRRSKTCAGDRQALLNSDMFDETMREQV